MVASVMQSLMLNRASADLDGSKITEYSSSVVGVENQIVEARESLRQDWQAR